MPFEAAAAVSVLAVATAGLAAGASAPLARALGVVAVVLGGSAALAAGSLGIALSPGSQLLGALAAALLGAGAGALLATPTRADAGGSTTGLALGIVAGAAASATLREVDHALPLLVAAAAALPVGAVCAILARRASRSDANDPVLRSER